MSQSKCGVYLAVSMRERKGGNSSGSSCLVSHAPPLWSWVGLVLVWVAAPHVRVAGTGVMFHLSLHQNPVLTCSLVLWRKSLRYSWESKQHLTTPVSSTSWLQLGLCSVPPRPLLAVRSWSSRLFHLKQEPVFHCIFLPRSQSQDRGPITCLIFLKKG